MIDFNKFGVLIADAEQIYSELDAILDDLPDKIEDYILVTCGVNDWDSEFCVSISLENDPREDFDTDNIDGRVEVMNEIYLAGEIQFTVNLYDLVDHDIWFTLAIPLEILDEGWEPLGINDIYDLEDGWVYDLGPITGPACIMEDQR